MLLLEVMMHDHQYSVVSTKLYIGLIIGLATFIYLYRKGLSEFWYAHKLLWILNLLIDLV